MAYTSRISKGSELTTAELDNNFLCHYPVGSLYINALKHSSPHTMIGYGRWEKHAEGYVLMSADSPSIQQLGDRPDDPKSGNSPDYFSPGVTGGSPSVQITDLIKHNHEWIDYNGYDGRYRMQGTQKFRNNGNSRHYYRLGGSYDSSYSGNDDQHNNLQPYITVNIWKRVK
tara:strand:+ start:352 stop:864 length:513 start_codon:yes stop_codon:yes gene_type:complete